MSDNLAQRSAAPAKKIKQLIGHAINGIHQMPQQNAALVEEASAAAESLAEQTEHLSGALAPCLAKLASLFPLS